MTKKLITNACCDRQHTDGDLQPLNHERLANNGKITNFARVTLFDAFMRRFPWT